ncbi:MAG: hypothetical protein GAK45_01109 [Pseudomonas citronellolis]|nr:MAG: hypothetical protein GAK45_01109 [Pseudomonas citronellolis]
MHGTRIPCLSHWLAALAALACLLACHLAHAASAVLIWPINPVLEADEPATALWLENRGERDVTLQIRVLAWSQAGFKDVYAQQRAVIASPPFVTVSPGSRQLVRLMRQGAEQPAAEDAYRVLIDEVPQGDDAARRQAGLTLQLQMRYSVPLFVSAPGIWTQERPDRPRSADTATRPQLTWRVEQADGQRFLLVRNQGKVHARLSQVRWQGTAGQPLVLIDGLLGYVLPGQQMRWPLPAGVQPGGGMQLHAKLADNAPSVTIPSF